MSRRLKHSSVSFIIGVAPLMNRRHLSNPRLCRTPLENSASISEGSLIREISPRRAERRRNASVGLLSEFFPETSTWRWRDTSINQSSYEQITNTKVYTDVDPLSVHHESEKTLSMNLFNSWLRRDRNYIALQICFYFDEWEFGQLWIV